MKALISLLWSLGSRLLRTLAAKGVLSAQDFGVRVISVGNIQAGGAGKTPLVATIAKEALQQGKSVAVLSRGYRGRKEKSGAVLLPGVPQSRQSVDAREYGDEVALLSEQLPEVAIGIGRDRIRVFRELCRVWKRPDLVILDDGFQHWKIRRNVDVVAVTGAKWGEKVFRDFAGALKVADLIVWTKGADCGVDLPAQFVKAEFKVGYYSERLWLVSGIGDPDSLRQSVLASGNLIMRETIFPDHHDYVDFEIADLLRDAASMDLKIAMTGKDWVKWKSFGVARSKVVVFEPEVDLVKGRDLWNRVLWGQ